MKIVAIAVSAFVPGAMALGRRGNSESTTVDGIECVGYVLICPKSIKLIIRII